VEFERFELRDETKLRQKLENLAIASLSSVSLQLCVLIYWVRTGAAPRSMSSVVNSYVTGFRRSGNPIPPFKMSSHDNQMRNESDEGRQAAIVF
jgi:hypothetical protein